MGHEAKVCEIECDKKKDKEGSQLVVTPQGLEKILESKDRGQRRLWVRGGSDLEADGTGRDGTTVGPVGSAADVRAGVRAGAGGAGGTVETQLGQGMQGKKTWPGPELPRAGFGLRCCGLAGELVGNAEKIFPKVGK